MTIHQKSKYLEDFKIEEVHRNHNIEKVLVYKGNFFWFDSSKKAYLHYKRVSLVCSLMCLLLLIAVTVSDPLSLRGTGALYVSLAYVGLVFAEFMYIFRVIYLQITTKNKAF